ncbi:hypothetical protein D3C85_891320 [compost metagenome]
MRLCSVASAELCARTVSDSRVIASRFAASNSCPSLISFTTSSGTLPLPCIPSGTLSPPVCSGAGPDAVTGCNPDDCPNASWLASSGEGEGQNRNQAAKTMTAPPPTSQGNDWPRNNGRVRMLCFFLTGGGGGGATGALSVGAVSNSLTGISFLFCRPDTRIRIRTQFSSGRTRVITGCRGYGVS